MSDPIAMKNLQIANLQQEIAALKAAKTIGPGSAYAEQMLAQARLQSMLPGVPPAAYMPPTFIAPTLPVAPEPAPTVTDVAFVETPLPEVPVPPPPASMPADAMAPLESVLTQQTAAEAPVEAAPVPPPETAMTTETPKPADARTFMPDVRMLAPLLKIALSALTIEQMVEVGLHVKQGAPGFREFLDSEVAREKFREMYGVYCEFLAGKLK